MRYCEDISSCNLCLFTTLVIRIANSCNADREGLVGLDCHSSVMIGFTNPLIVNPIVGSIRRSPTIDCAW